MRISYERCKRVGALKRRAESEGLEVKVIATAAGYFYTIFDRQSKSSASLTRALKLRDAELYVSAFIACRERQS